MNEILMLPMDEFNRLSSYYQGKMTESALLNKAERFAADQHLILRHKNISDSMVVNNIKPTTEQGRLIKRVRTGTAQPDRYEGVEEPEGMVDAPVGRFLRQFVKGQKVFVVTVKPRSKILKGIAQHLHRQLRKGRRRSFERPLSRHRQSKRNQFCLPRVPFEQKTNS